MIMTRIILVSIQNDTRKNIFNIILVSINEEHNRNNKPHIVSPTIISNSPLLQGPFIEKSHESLDVPIQFHEMPMSHKLILVLLTQTVTN
jgi:hypothetical protein